MSAAAFSVPSDATQIHVCSSAETDPNYPNNLMTLMGVSGVRDAVMSIWEVVNMAGALRNYSRRDESPKGWTFSTLRSWVRYGTEVWSRKRKVPMDIDKLVIAWVPIVRGLSTAHSKDEIDRCEFEAETHLAPLLTAPVKQLRAFYAALCLALRTDPTIPMFVWTAFDAWHEAIVKVAPDEGIRELKTALAKEVADLVEKDVAPDLNAALVGALQWRSPEALTKIRDAVQAGAKPRMKARESCMFLFVNEGQPNEVCAML